MVGDFRIKEEIIVFRNNRNEICDMNCYLLLENKEIIKCNQLKDCIPGIMCGKRFDEIHSKYKGEYYHCLKIHVPYNTVIQIHNEGMKI